MIEMSKIDELHKLKTAGKIERQKYRKIKQRIMDDAVFGEDIKGYVQFLKQHMENHGDKGEVYYLLALLHQNVQNENMDYDLALENLEKSVDEGYFVAYHEIGNLILSKEKFIKKEHLHFSEYFKKGAENGSSISKAMHGTLLVLSNNSDEDVKIGFEYLIQSYLEGILVGIEYIATNLYKISDSGFEILLNRLEVDIEENNEILNRLLLETIFSHKELSQLNIYKERMKRIILILKDRNYPGLYCNLGLLEKSELFGDVNLEKAVDCYQKAREMGIAEGSWRLAEFLMEYEKTPEDYEDVNAMIREAISRGYENIHSFLARRLHSGKGRELYEGETINLYKEAAAQGDKEALTLLGLIYYFGEKGVEKDCQKAVEYLEMGLPCEGAYLTLSNCYLMGEGVEKNTKKGIQILLRGVQTENVSCMVEYGRMCLSGKHGVIKNPENGIGLLKRAYELGEHNNTVLVAEILSYYVNIEDREPQDLKEGMEWLRRLSQISNMSQNGDIRDDFVLDALSRNIDIERGEYTTDPQSMESYGSIIFKNDICLKREFEMYESNNELREMYYWIQNSKEVLSTEEVAQYRNNPKKVKELIEKMGEKDKNGQECFALGYCYENGIGCRINKHKAFRCYGMGLCMQDESSIINHAIMLALGEVCTSNIYLACALLSDSAELGNRKAGAILKYILDRILPTDIPSCKEAYIAIIKNEISETNERGGNVYKEVGQGRTLVSEFYECKNFVSLYNR